MAAEGKQSPQESVDALKRVTLEDVNRVAKQYLLQPSIDAVLKPTQSGEAAAAKGFGGSEKATNTPTKPVALPEWADAAVKSLRVPESHIASDGFEAAERDQADCSTGDCKSYCDGAGFDQVAD